MEREAWPFITVIVPVRNEAACIERTLTKLATFNYPTKRYEIIVADGQSEDDTVAIVEQLQTRFPQIRLFNNPKRWSSAARNIGIREGRGDYFVLIDGHCDIDDPDYLQRVVEAFEKTGADCLGRPQPLEITHATPVQQAIALARRSWLGHNPSSYIYSTQGGFVKASSVAIAYRRAVFEKVGLFDERFDACEDVELNHRVDVAGLTCWFEPGLTIHYHPRRSIPALIKQMVRYGQGRIRLALKHPEALSLPAVAPLLFFTTCLACAVVGLWRRELALVAAILTITYLTIVFVTSTGLAFRRSCWQAKLWLPAVFFAVHLGFAWGTLSEFGGMLRRLLVNGWLRRPIPQPVGEWLPVPIGDNSRQTLPLPPVHQDIPETERRAAA
jgi:succinoglycan biosynthesis protein ExoA